VDSGTFVEIDHRFARCVPNPVDTRTAPRWSASGSLRGRSSTKERPDAPRVPAFGRTPRSRRCASRSPAAGSSSRRRPPSRVPGGVPARRGDEPLPVRSPRQRAQGLPLHARSRCRRSLPNAWRLPPTARRARSSRRGSRTHAGSRSNLRERSTAPSPAPTSTAIAGSKRRRRRSGGCDDTTWWLRARLSPRPSGGAHDRQPRWQQCRGDGARRRSDPVPTRTGCGRPGRSSPRRGRGVTRAAQPGFRKPRSLGKFFRFGNTVSRLASLTPNQRPSVLPIVSTEVTGR